MPSTSPKPPKKIDADEHDDELATKPINPIIDALLGLALAGEFVWFCYFNLSSKIFDDPLTIASIASLPIMLTAIVLVKRLSHSVGAAISSLRVGANIPKDCRDPLNASAIRMQKWEDQAWQLAIHVLMCAFEAYLLFFGGAGPGSERWWVDPNTTKIPCPVHAPVGSPLSALRMFYIIQITIWFVTAVSCKLLEERRKDYCEMMLHHIFTIALVMESLYNGELGYGLVVLFVHDASDVALDLMKMANYLKMEDAHGCYVTEVLFVVNTYISWPFFRLYYYPFKILPVMWQYAKMCPGQQKYIGTTMLCILLVMHCFWWFLLNRIAYKLVNGVSSHQAGEEEYEQTRKED